MLREIRREIVSEVRRLFTELKEKVSFDTPEFVDDLFDHFWKKWNSSFQNTNFFNNPDISNDMQQVFLESPQLKQLDVYSSRQEYIIDKTNFKLVGRSEFDEISSIIPLVQAEFCYYTLLDYQHGKLLLGKIKNFFQFGKQQHNEADSKEIQMKLQSVFSDHSRFVDDLIRKIPQNSNYDKDYFLLLIDRCINLISEHNRSEKENNARQSLILTNYYIFDFVFYQCCRAIEQFESLQENFVEQSSLERKIDQLESTVKDMFHQLCAGIQSENLCATQLTSVLIEGMKEHLKDTVLQLLYRLFTNDPQHGTIYSSRASLQLSVLKELANKKDFDAYISYINSPFTYFDTFILKNIRSYSIKQFVLSNILVNINQCTHDFRTQCVEITRSAHTQGIDTFIGWKQHFHRNIIHSVRGVKLSDLEILDVYTVEDLKQFSELFLQSLDDCVKKVDWEDWIRNILTRNDLRVIKDNIMDYLIECKALCPFCREPCQLSAGEHEHYCGTFHRPEGISGWRYLVSKIICLQECTTNIRCNNTFIYEDKRYKFRDYRTVNGYFNSWRILEGDSIESKYWQWVLYTFHKEFVDHYGILPNDKIGEWSNLTEEEVINDIERHYQNYLFKTEN